MRKRHLARKRSGMCGVGGMKESSSKRGMLIDGEEEDGEDDDDKDDDDGGDGLAGDEGLMFAFGVR